MLPNGKSMSSPNGGEKQELKNMFKDIKLADDEIYLEMYQCLPGDGDNPPAYRFCIKTHSDGSIVGRCSFRVGGADNRHIKYVGNIGYVCDVFPAASKSR